MSTSRIRFPAEWEPHRATWIAWPHEATDWPGKLAAIDWVYTEIVRKLAESEVVEILTQDELQIERARECLVAAGATLGNVRFHVCLTNRSWLRDSAPVAVLNNHQTNWVQFNFNAWAKYPDYDLDQLVPDFIAKVMDQPLVQALRPSGQPFVIEGGAIDCDGAGTLLATKECLLSEIQERNPGCTAQDYETLLAKYLGIEKTIWLEGGCEGDDTHGHVDDVARFVAPAKVLLAFESNPNEAFHKTSIENERILENSTDAAGNRIEVRRLPMPQPLYFNGQRLPASYANFYIANTCVLVPTFNDANDRHALNIIADCFPNRTVVGIAAVDLVLGLGTLHCLTQQEPS